MAEPTVITFTFKELATILIKAQDIHEGIWGVYFKFGIQGANAGPDEANVLPTAMVPILEVGIQKMAAVNNLSVNASEVNPLRVGVHKTPEPKKRKILK